MLCCFIGLCMLWCCFCAPIWHFFIPTIADRNKHMSCLEIVPYTTRSYIWQTQIYISSASVCICWHIYLKTRFLDIYDAGLLCCNDCLSMEMHESIMCITNKLDFLITNIIQHPLFWLDKDSVQYCKYLSPVCVL